MENIALIVAVAENGVIGKENGLPWRLPKDLQYFKQVTMGHPIVMGRLTFDSIGKPLPGRENIVVTRQNHWKAEGVYVAHDLPEAFDQARKTDQGRQKDKIMVIGGAQLYKLALPVCNEMYLTEVHCDVEGDAYFPHFDRTAWDEVSRQRHEACEKNPYSYSFVKLVRKV